MNELEYTPLSDIPGIIDNVRHFYNTGLTKDLAFRKHQLKQVIRFLEENQMQLEQAVWCDLKKHRMELLAEVAPVISECKYLLDNLDRLAKPTSPKKWYWIHALDTTSVRKVPKGVVLIISPWSYPSYLAFMPVINAIAAGNCVILKPSEMAPHTTSFLSRTLTGYLDRRFFKIINGAVDETALLLDQPFDHIHYTGSTMVGRTVLEKAAKRLTPTTLELGGKVPTLVTSDSANQVTANRITLGKFTNCGQTSLAPDYILVQRDGADSLVKALGESIRDFYGNMPETSDSYGRIINQQQFDRLKKMIDGVDPDTVVVGGQVSQDDLYIAPTLIYPASIDGTELIDDEIFGPILPVVPVDSVDDAIAIVNIKPHPLAIYVFSNQQDQINKVIQNTKSGGVLVNDTLSQVLDASLPFGGVGASGLGNCRSDNSFSTFSYERSIIVKSTKFESVNAVRYPPFDLDKYNVSRIALYGLPSCIYAKFVTIKTALGSFIAFYFGPSPPSVNSKVMD